MVLRAFRALRALRALKEPRAPRTLECIDSSIFRILKIRLTAKYKSK